MSACLYTFLGCFFGSALFVLPFVLVREVKSFAAAGAGDIRGS